ncbi:MFS multidrug transporter [Aspergillus bombycis]|uniref:MFS multidrug transporter n=1 Tax=Aspergillus bombycis TaxID=109264 RepID=A0A1F7ZX77_9EURO|nr:MFS multidrug transporter [Aspergillus bombycis]OGM44073.1 MFS multidrug transporter [Aspergillus bombycis]
MAKGAEQSVIVQTSIVGSSGRDDEVEAGPSTVAKMSSSTSDENYKLVELSDHEILVEFKEGSPANPNNWDFNKKVYNVLIALFVVLNSGVSSSLPSNAVPAIMEDFHQHGDGQKVLPTAIFLIGYVVGPLAFSPLSETIGRKPVLTWTFTIFVLATLACALAPNWSSLLVFRAICGTMGAAPQTVVGGVYADMFSDLRSRGRVMAFYMSAASFGPIVGPIISGCSVQYGWRWTFRIDLIFAGISWIGLMFMSETFAPVILKHKAAKLRKESGCSSYLSRQELQNGGFRYSTTQIITRPITMLLFEPIILFTALYISLAYSLVFFYFQAYPIIFEGTYNFDVQTTSLTYIPSNRHRRRLLRPNISILRHNLRESQSSRKGLDHQPRTAPVPISCVAGPCLTISLFWLGWTANRNIHWIAPVLSGLLFGVGYQMIFISLLTYVTDAYKIYSASALAASVILRSIVGALFPLAADPLYSTLGVGWATSVLGFASLACIPIPFALLYAGPWIRTRSPFCQRLLEEDLSKERAERTVEGV